jgi:hypothetical protein
VAGHRGAVDDVIAAMRWHSEWIKQRPLAEPGTGCRYASVTALKAEEFDDGRG